MRRHLYYYTLVEGDPGPLRDALLAAPGSWLPEPASPVDDGARWMVTLHADGALPASLAARDVVVELERPGDGPEGLWMPLRWRAAEVEQAFPTFAGDLQLLELEGDASQLSLMGSYEPPLAVVGSVFDKAVGHRVAEACVRRFVLDVATNLTACPHRG